MPNHNSRVLPIIYWTVLSVVALWVLVAFLTPSARHSGLNLYKETRFPAMVQGTAIKPFVYRTLLPSTVRVLSQVTPSTLCDRIDLATEQTQFLKQTFDRFGWEYRSSIQYYFATLLMWISFVGFAHFTVLLTCQQLSWPAGTGWQIIMGAAALLGLPAMFKYSSFPYDPTQLFLFSLALYLLASQRMRLFLFVFLLCCLSKETAVLLIPIYAVFRWKRIPTQLFGRELGFLIIGYAIVKGVLIWVFWHNPGTFARIHFFDHNLGWFLDAWRWPEMAVMIVLGVLVFYRWQQKPLFLRIAFLGTLPILVGFALLLGFIDEWRGYYEAYPVVFAMSMSSLRSLFSIYKPWHI